MAAITAPTNAALCSPPGYENVDVGYASADITAGQPVIIDPAGAPSTRWERAFTPATGTVAHGIALKTTLAGGTAEVAYRGEVDGYSGLTPGAGLTIVGGNIDTTAPTGNAVIRAVSATRIRFDLI